MFGNNLKSPCQTLEKESESAIDWFINNSMITNPDQHQVIILSKDALVAHKLRIYDEEIETTKSAKLKCDSQGQETFLPPSADKQIHNYDKESSNHHPSISTLR